MVTVRDAPGPAVRLKGRKPHAYNAALYCGPAALRPDPHGVCAPLKNCRKRRFRKVLRKNYVEAPEIEKEVRHLLRIDNEAVDVKWELVRKSERFCVDTF